MSQGLYFYCDARSTGGSKDPTRLNVCGHSLKQLLDLKLNEYDTDRFNGT